MLILGVEIFEEGIGVVETTARMVPVGKSETGEVAVKPEQQKRVRCIRNGQNRPIRRRKVVGKESLQPVLRRPNLIRMQVWHKEKPPNQPSRLHSRSSRLALRRQRESERCLRR